MAVESRENPQTKFYHELHDAVRLGHAMGTLKGAVERGEVTEGDGMRIAKNVLKDQMRAWRSAIDGKDNRSIASGDSDLKLTLWHLEQLGESASDLGINIEDQIDETREALYKRYPRARNLRPEPWPTASQKG